MKRIIVLLICLSLLSAFAIPASAAANGSRQTFVGYENDEVDLESIRYHSEREKTKVFNISIRSDNNVLLGTAEVTAVGVYSQADHYSSMVSIQSMNGAQT